MNNCNLTNFVQYFTVLAIFQYPFINCLQLLSYFSDMTKLTRLEWSGGNALLLPYSACAELISLLYLSLENFRAIYSQGQ